jgi:hypothetical protein
MFRAGDDEYLPLFLAKPRPILPLDPSLSPTAIAIRNLETERQEEGTKRVAKLYNPYAGLHSARQLDETVDAFLSRLPPATTSVMTNGPWIYIANPYRKPQLLDENWAEFMKRGENVLTEFSEAKTKIEKGEKSNPANAVSTAVALESATAAMAIQGAAKETGCVVGKVRNLHTLRVIL